MDVKNVGIQLNCLWSIYDPRILEEVEKLKNRIVDLEKEKNRLVVVLELFSNRTLNAFTQDDYTSFLSNKTLTELFNHLAVLRKVVQMIRSSKHIWIGVVLQDTLGLFAEFPLACKQIFLGENARLGFPEIEAGAFPCLGAFEDRCVSGDWLRKNLENSPVLNTENIAKLPWISRLVKSDEKSQIDDWVTEFLEGEKRSKPIIKALEILPLELSDEGYESLSASQTSHSLENLQNRPWRIMWDLMRQKLSAKQANEYASSVVFQHARFILSRVFHRWLSRYLLLDRVELSMPDPSRTTLVVDLDFLAPPAQPLAKLILKKFHIVFWAADVDRLKESLDLCFARLERSFGSESARYFWQQGVSWMTSENEPSDRFCRMQWFPDDHVRFRLGNNQRTVLRFCSNRTNSNTGYVEFSSIENRHALTQDPCLRIANQMSNGIIVSTPVAGVSLSCYIRSLFLQELIKAARHVPGGLSHLMPSLKESGWGFVADDNAWEYFLRSREEIYSIDSRLLKLGPLGIKQNFWQMGIFKEAKEFSRMVDEKSQLLVPARVSQQFAILAGLVARVAVEHKLVGSEDEADLFVAECLGFPNQLGTPLSFLKDLGLLRAEYYWKSVSEQLA